MSLKTRSYLGAVGLAVVAALGPACGAVDENDQDQPVAETPSTAAASIERFELGDGVKLEYSHDAQAGVVAVSIAGPVSARTKIATLSRVDGGLADLHRSAFPRATVPAPLLELDAETRLGIAASAGASRVLGIEEPAVPPLQNLNVQSVDKSASSFQSTYCGNQVSRSQTRAGWYYVKDWCFTNVTNDNNLTLSTVRQGYGAIEMASGTSTYTAKYRTSGTSSWTTYGTYSVPAGTIRWVRIWSTTTAPLDVNFATTNAAGDTFHITAQRAESPLSAMTNKTDKPGQQHVIYCSCMDTFDEIQATASRKGCLRPGTYEDAQKRDQPTDDDAYNACNAYCKSLQSTYSVYHTALSYEALPNSMGCTPSVNTTPYP